jgi:hypothetical protein
LRGDRFSGGVGRIAAPNEPLRSLERIDPAQQGFDSLANLISLASQLSDFRAKTLYFLLLLGNDPFEPGGVLLGPLLQAASLPEAVRDSLDAAFQFQQGIEVIRRRIRSSDLGFHIHRSARPPLILTQIQGVAF